jgi:hypothetical protein
MVHVAHIFSGNLVMRDVAVGLGVRDHVLALMTEGLYQVLTQKPGSTGN